MTFLKQGTVRIYSRTLSRALMCSVGIASLIACSDYFGESPPKKPPPSEIIQGPPTQGKVINAMRGGGYTYMHLEEQGQKFWIASQVINVKRNDVVSWDGASVMTDFKSASLSKSFDEIYFVKSIKVEK